MFAGDAGDLAFKISDTGLARVMSHDEVDRLVLEVNLIRLQSAVFTTTRDQIIPRDLHLLLFSVSRQLDHFHTVA